MSEGAPIVQERVLPAPPPIVFAAWSDAASLRQWMCPGEIERAEAEVDFRVGGCFRVVIHGEGQGCGFVQNHRASSAGAYRASAARAVCFTNPPRSSPPSPLSLVQRSP